MALVTKLRLLPMTGMLLSVACGTVATEESETLTDPGPRDGAFDAALSFDGVDDYASTGTARFPHIERDQTHMLWVQPEARVEARQCLSVLRRSRSSGIQLSLEDNVPVVYNVSGPRDLARGLEPLAVGQWHHLAYVLVGRESKLYVDGVSIEVEPRDVITNRTPTLGFIGSFDGASEPFRGLIDEVRVYHRALSPEEIASEAEGQGSISPEQLVLYLTFDEASGARSYDRSGLGNHALLGDGVPSFMPERVPSDAPGAGLR